MGLFGRGRTTTIENRADKISEFTVNTAEYGTVVPEVLGTTRLSGNLIYYDDFTAHEHRDEQVQRSGKGGGHSETVTVNITYTYTVACIFGLCEGQISGIGKVWRGKEIYTYPNSNIQLSLFNGSQNQQPWAYVVGRHPEKAMSYAGLAYMAGVIDMGTSASLPQFNFEVYGKLLNTGDGIDVNPADYIRYVLDKVGLSNVPIEGLEDYRGHCFAENLLISSPPDSRAISAREVVNEIAKLTNAYFFWSNDRFKIVPLKRYPDTPIYYDLTKDDFLPQSNGALVTYSRKDSTEDYNSFPVEFYNRQNGYEKETVSYQFSEDIRQNGLRQAPVTSAPYIYTKERAVRVAEMLAKNSKLERNVYTFKLGWAFALLESGDIVTLTDENIGIVRLPVRISSVTEDAKGTLVCTAVAVENVSGDAIYDIHETERPYIDLNVEPPNTAPPLIMQPPLDLTTNGLELWIGAKGAGENWGGCTVYVSDDNLNYRTVGQINTSSRIGKLEQAMSASDNSCVISCNGTLLSGTTQDAERANTLIWINGECMSYTTATLLQNGNYKLDGIVRGQYNTAVVSHGVNEQFARLDGTMLKEPLRKEDIGKKIYLKFCSFNTFGAKEQSLSDVQAYEYTIQEYYIPYVQNLTVRNRYRQMKDGVKLYDIVVHWDEPNLQNYQEGRVWYKTNAGQVKYLNFSENKPITQLGFSEKWLFGGAGKNEVVIPQAVVGDLYRIAVTTVDIYGSETSPDVSPQKEILVAIKSETPNTPDGFSITFGVSAIASWKEVSNSDIAFYEVRLDDNQGVPNDKMLARVTSFSTTVPLTQRKGRLYLYACSASGKFSSPAILDYNKPAPKASRAPILSSKLGGFSIAADPIPAGCLGMNIYIDPSGADLQKVYTQNNVYGYMCEANVYEVSVAYVDYFGEGEISYSSVVLVKATIDGALLEAESVSLEKCTEAVAQAIEAGEYSKDQIVQLVAAMGEMPEQYTALVQLVDALELRVKSGEIISKINMSPETITIDGKYVHITGDTVFDNNVIVNNMIQANAVTADKMLIGGTTGARLALTNNLLSVYDANGRLRVRMGVWEE